MKHFYLSIYFIAVVSLGHSQSFTYPTNGNAVDGQLLPLVSPDGVRMVISISSVGCVPKAGSKFQYNTEHVSTGAIYRNTSWAEGCVNSQDIIKMDFTTAGARPLGLKFSIFDVDNGSDSVSVAIYSQGHLVDYNYFLYSSTFVTAHGSSPRYGFVGTGSSNSGLDDNSGRIDLMSVDPYAIVDSVLIYKLNNRNVVGNPSQSFAALSWNNYVVLPVKLIDFTATRRSDKIQFDWKVAQEMGKENYQVEYSLDGNTFTKTGNQVASRGNGNSEVAYSCLSVVPSNSKVLFFRLVSTDINGKIIYSKIIKLHNNSIATAVVYPTVFKDNFSLKIKSEYAGNGYITLIAVDGSIQYKQQLNIKEGENIISIQIPSSLSAGFYTVAGTVNNIVTFHSKIIKQ